MEKRFKKLRRKTALVRQVKLFLSLLKETFVMFQETVFLGDLKTFVTRPIVLTCKDLSFKDFCINIL